MAEIRLTAMKNCNGPMIPSEYYALIMDRPWPGGGRTEVLYLGIGNDSVEIWPADPIRIRELGEKLIRIANELEENRSRRKNGVGN